jgi:hypothetical protein
LFIHLHAYSKAQTPIIKLARVKEGNKRNKCRRTQSKQGDLNHFEKKKKSSSYTHANHYPVVMVVTVIELNSILYVFTCLAQQPMTNYRVSTNTNNNNVTAQDKTNKKHQRQRIINQFYTQN